VALERLDLDRPARLRRHDEQRLLAVDGLVDGEHGRGVGVVEDVETQAGRRAVRLPREGPAQHLGREGAAAHAEEHGVGEAPGAHLGGEGAELAELRLHERGRAQPAEARLDRRVVGGVGREQSGIALPEALGRAGLGQPQHLRPRRPPRSDGVSTARARPAACSSSAARRAVTAPISVVIDPVNDFTPSSRRPWHTRDRSMPSAASSSAAACAPS